MPKEIKLPQWGMNMNDGTVIKWLKSIGDDVAKGDELVEIESTKVNAAVEAPESGKLGRIDIEEGSLVPVGTILGIILNDGEKIEDVPSPTLNKNEEKKETSISLSSKKTEVKFIASPRARNLAKKLNIELANIIGTGPSGRITEEDVKAYQDTPKPIQSSNSLILNESIPNTGIRQIIAKRMYESSQNPQVTLNTTACIDNLLKIQKQLVSEWRKEKIRPQINDLLVKIVSNTLEKHIKLNSHYLDNTLNIWKNINIGVAMAVKDGLVVPVVNNTESKNNLEISKEIRSFAKKIKENQLLPDEITGSTFTISNLSSFNVEYFNPIINPPEVSILGLGKVSTTIDIDENNQLIKKNIIFLSLTFDHRALDGVPASNFLDSLVKNIEST